MNALKDFGCGAALLIVSVAIVVVGLIGFWAARVYFAEEIGAGNARIEIFSSDSRIVRYEHFFAVCQSVQNAEAGIDSQTNALNQATSESERSVIRRYIAGLESARAQAINEYNAEASKDYTSANFLDADLPYQLSTEPYVPGGEKTSCAA